MFIFADVGGDGVRKLVICCCRHKCMTPKPCYLGKKVTIHCFLTKSSSSQGFHLYTTNSVALLKVKKQNPVPQKTRPKLIQANTRSVCHICKWLFTVHLVSTGSLISTPLILSGSVLKKFTKFTGKQLCQLAVSVYSILNGLAFSIHGVISTFHNHN